MRLLKRLDVLFIIIVLTIMITPVLFTNIKREVKSDFDNRILVEFPEIDDSNFENKVENYLQDRIGFRDYMVTGFQLLNDVVGELRHPIYTYGEDGYVFFEMSDTIHFGKYHKTFAEAVLKMQEYCESRGVKFYFLFDPEKKSIYRRYLPKGINYSDEWVDELFSYMSELGINYVDNRTFLYDLSFEEQVFNTKYDAGHWNDLGCYYGTNNLWKRIHEDFSSVTEYSFDEFTITKDIGKYLASSRFPVNEEIPVFNINTKYKNISDKYSDLRLNKNYSFFQYYINDDEGSEQYPKMLIFQGSYYNRSPQFFIGRAQEYIGIHDYQNVIDLDYYLNIFDPDLVVFEVAQYTFSDQYFNSTAMASIDYNPGLSDNNQSIEEAIHASIDQGEEFSFESSARLNIVEGTGYDTIYFEKPLENAKYVYLFTDHGIYDIRKDSHGVFSAGIPKEQIHLGDTVIIFYQDFLGKSFYASLPVQKAEQNGKDLFCSSGVKYTASSKRIIFQTNIKKNNFSSIIMQLLVADTGECIREFCSKNSTGTFSESYLHLDKTGWYRIRLKMNTNLQDEYIEFFTYLIQGQRYYYSFDVTEFKQKLAVVNNFQFFGPSPFSMQYVEMIDELSCSDGVKYTEDNAYIMRTDLKDNAFSSMILQMKNLDTDELVDPLSIANNSGYYQGIYCHDNPDAIYSVWLRANSNQKDEYVATTIKLEKGKVYHWSYELIRMDEKEAEIKDLSFAIIGEK